MPLNLSLWKSDQLFILEVIHPDLRMRAVWNIWAKMTHSYLSLLSAHNQLTPCQKENSFPSHHILLLLEIILGTLSVLNHWTSHDYRMDALNESAKWIMTARPLDHDNASMSVSVFRHLLAFQHSLWLWIGDITVLHSTTQLTVLYIHGKSLPWDGDYGDQQGCFSVRV